MVENVFLKNYGDTLWIDCVIIVYRTASIRKVIQVTLLQPINMHVTGQHSFGS